MVYLVEDSMHACCCRENNQQLARALSEVEQQRAIFVKENSDLRQELHRRSVQILDLENKFTKENEELRRENSDLRSKLNEIRCNLNVIVDKIPRDSVDDRRHFKAVHSSLSSPLKALPSTCHSVNATLTRSNIDSSTEHHTSSLSSPPSVSSGHSEPGSPSDNEGDKTPTNDATTSRNTTLEAHVLNTIVEENDSLDPHSVSSVPPITAVPERTMHTPSIWNCLSPLGDGMYMQESTPARPTVQANVSPVSPPRASVVFGVQQHEQQLVTPSKPRESPQKWAPTKEQDQENQVILPSIVEKPRRGRGRKIQAESRAKREVKFDQPQDMHCDDDDKNAGELQKERATTEQQNQLIEPARASRGEAGRYNLRKRSRT